MRKILMLATGGTIASKQTEQGMLPGISPEEVLSYVPQIRRLCEVDTYQVCNIDSTNITPLHWEMITRAIETHYYEYDGFVILHGTDTLAYTAAALSYMIQNADKPIVITGAQRPIDMDVTDAKTNLIDSFAYAVDDGSCDVCIVFDGKVISGTRAKKVNAKSYNAFESINFPYIAIIQDQRVIRYLPKTKPKEELCFYHKMDKAVCVIKLTPGMNPLMLSCIIKQHDGIVIESFGVGGVPSALTDEFYRVLDEMPEKTVVMATQVENEGSNMSVYEVGKKVKYDFNMMEAYDMTLEATITKLMWLLSRENLGDADKEKEFYRRINNDILYVL